MKLGTYLTQLRNAEAEQAKVLMAFEKAGHRVIHDQVDLTLSDFAELEARVLGTSLEQLRQREALGLLVVTFSATKAEQLAKLYGMGAARRWDTFVSDETKARMRRRRRRAL